MKGIDRTEAESRGVVFLGFTKDSMRNMRCEADELLGLME